MALLWFDGFENYEHLADILAVDGRYTYNDTLAFQAYGRNGGRNLYISYQDYVRAAIPEEPSTIIWGFAVRDTNPAAPVVSNDVARVLSAALDGPLGNVHLYFQVTASRTIVCKNSAWSTIGTTSGHTLSYNVWHYVEIKATISDTVGQVTINVDGVERLSTSADKDTKNGANAYVGAIQLGQIYNHNIRFDDFYVCDTSGSKNNDFLGDIRVDVLRPNAPGTYADFNPSTGANWENVDETYPTGTEYNDGSNVGDQDSYNVASLPSPAGTTIHGVKSQITVKKTDATLRKCKILTRAGSTDDLGPTITLTIGYETHAKIFEDNPDDSADWEDADVNAVEVGVEVTV